MACHLESSAAVEIPKIVVNDGARGETRTRTLLSESDFCAGAFFSVARVRGDAMRSELTPTEYAEHIQRRQEIWEAMYDQSEQLVPVESKREDGKGHRWEAMQAETAGTTCPTCLVASPPCAGGAEPVALAALATLAGGHVRIAAFIGRAEGRLIATATRSS